MRFYNLIILPTFAPSKNKKRVSFMEYDFNEIEKKWQKYWNDNKIYKTEIDHSRPKYYVLDMFPYPSGAGLHVGHPLGYIASDIFSRYKRMKGFNVLHPMGFDAFGLPAEQYAIQTGQHPAITTEQNIKRYREQLDKIGFNYDWDREVQTCDPDYYLWTQWAFVRMFESYYCLPPTHSHLPPAPSEGGGGARAISELVEYFEKYGTENLNVAQSEELHFTADEWNSKTEKEKQEILLNYRIAYLSNTTVNWCPKLGTVLANDEVINGLSERGGYPVEQRLMRQWSLRVSAYSQRLLDGLETIEWTESLKETQRNWIGRSDGAEMKFKIKNSDLKIEIFTTRPDTIFGVTFMVLAPESEYVNQVTTKDQIRQVNNYLEDVKHKTERDRMTERKVTGVFTGSYAVNPFNGCEIPIWISDYVLAGYGTGAIMAVPGHDSRDHAFAKHFNLPIISLIEGCDVSEESFDAKEGIMMNSGFLNGLSVKEAIEKTKVYIKDNELGKIKVNYRLRDAIFSRQRFWGEPFPVYYKDSMPYMLPFDKLPLELPEVEKFLPTETGEPPLGNAAIWAWDELIEKVVESSKIDNKTIFPLELNTMPGFAGSSAYYLRYMDPHNNKALVSNEADEYWRSVDLYMGGTEHATGHLIYARFWNKFLFDIGVSCEDEPFKRLINQGMIQGRSNFIYRMTGENKFVSFNLISKYETQPLHVDVNIVENDVLNLELFKKWRPEFDNAEFILEDGKYICGYAVEKMGKRYHNVVNPDDIVQKYGADTLRLYEMFLGPIEQSKPWDTAGIEGVHKFLRKVWRLFIDKDENLTLTEEEPSPEELKALHRAIKKTGEDIERFSFNTAVSSFMICVNELTDLKCSKRAVLEPFLIILSPFAPHICEELWHRIGKTNSICTADWVNFNPKYLEESVIQYPVSFNGKMRFKLEMPTDASVADIEKAALSDEQAKKWIENKIVQKVVVVPKKIINVVTKD